MIKSSTDPKVQELRVQIDALNKKRREVFGKMKDVQRRLNYKTGELDAISKLSEMEKKQLKEIPDISKLKRQRHMLEFKVSTEANSLPQEKLLIRKINEVNSQIEEALKSVRKERKILLVKKDIAELQTTLNSIITELTGLDKNLDDLYHSIRKILGVEKRRPNIQQQQKQKPIHRQQEINLEDIVVIKKKDNKKPQPDGNPDGAG
jgi:uncharacterized coiled-coil DUF342 family protein